MSESLQGRLANSHFRMASSVPSLLRTLPSSKHGSLAGAPLCKRSHPASNMAASMSLNFSALAAHLGGSSPAPSKAVVPASMRGRWVKDKDLSCPMGHALDLMQMGGIVRQAVKLIRGMNIEADDDTLTVQVLSVVSWFKVTERFPLDGSTTKLRRRDLRRGGASCCLLPQQKGPHGGLLLNLQWGEPLAGKGEDEFVVVPCGTAAAEKKGEPVHAADEEADPAELHVYSLVQTQNGSARYRTVFHRK